MIHQNLTPFQFGAKATSRQPPQVEMTVFVRGAFRLQHEQKMEPIEDILEAGSLSGDTFAEDDFERTGAVVRASDLVDFKPRGEILVTGSCHTPGGKPLAECPVSVRIGEWDKTLVVSGDRHWQPKLIGTGMIPPVSFTQMPLTWENAYGGEGFAENPVGKGHGDSTELPNIEYATQKVKKKRDRAMPAGFAAINPAWPQRASKRGKNYGKAYQRERAPWYSDDFDWTFFQCAPADQQFEGYFTGNEQVILQNMHPEHPVLVTELPGQRVRVFVKDVTGEIREVEMVLDTIDVNADEMRASLLWRGLIPVQEDDLTDVTVVLVAAEGLDEEPKPLDGHYRPILEKYEADPIGLEDKLPDGFQEAAENAKAMKDAGMTPADAIADMELPADGQGNPISQFLDKQAPGLMPDSQAKFADAMSQVGSQWPTEMPPPIPGHPALPQPPGLNETLLSGMANPGTLPVSVPPVANPQFAISGLMSMIAPVKASMMSAGVDPSTIQTFDDQVLNNPGLQKFQPGYQPPVVEPHPDIVPPPKEPGQIPELPEHVKQGQPKGYEQSPQEGVTDGKRDVSYMDFRNQDLQHEDFTDALCVGTIFQRANLAGVSFRNADLKYADLSRCQLDGCDFTGADLSFAVLDKSSLSAADLSETNLDNTGFSECVLVGATLYGANAKLTRFQDADLSGAAGGNINADGAMFDNATLEDADFAEATLVKVSFRGVKASRIDLTEATVTGFCAIGADLREARCVGLNGERSIWMEANAIGIDFSGAELTKAVFNDADLNGALFFRANLPDAMMRKADLTSANLMQANLLRAELPLAQCISTDFRDANLYETVLYDANLLQAVFDGARGLDKAVMRPS